MLFLQARLIRQQTQTEGFITTNPMRQLAVGKCGFQVLLPIRFSIMTYKSRHHLQPSMNRDIDQDFAFAGR